MKFDVKQRYLKLSKLWVFIDPILKVWLELMVPLFYAFQEVQVAYVFHYSISKEGGSFECPRFWAGSTSFSSLSWHNSIIQSYRSFSSQGNILKCTLKLWIVSHNNDAKISLRTSILKYDAFMHYCHV